jgi:hypothetical protein
MPVLRTFIPIPTPALEVSNNQFKFGSRMGFVYQPQAAPNLTGPWTNQGASYTGNGQSITLTMQPGTGASGFYRVQVTRAP